jgi:O-antigen ligase
MWDPFHTGGYFSISKFAGFLYLAIMIPAIIKFNTPEEFKPILRSIAGFFLVLTAVSLFNVRRGYFDIIDFTILQNIILLWILVNHNSLDDLVLRKGLLSYAWGSVLMGFLFYMGIGIDYDAVDNRYSMFGENANYIGIRTCISLIIIPVSLIQNRDTLNKIHYLLIPGFLLIFNTMIATGSRVSFLAFIMAYLIFITLYKPVNKWGKPLIILSGILILAYVLVIALKSQEVLLRLAQSLHEGDLSDRDVVWKNVIPIWLQNPLFGVGRTGYEHIALNTVGRVDSPHNVLIEILCLTGITGLAFYLVFLYRITLMGYQTFRQNGQLLAILLLIPLFGLLLSAQLLQMKIGWVIFSYVIANAIAAKRSVAVENEVLA